MKYNKRIADKHNQPLHITNKDEAPLTFDIPVNYTVEKKGTNTVRMGTNGCVKSPFTVVLGCYGNGRKRPK